MIGPGATLFGRLEDDDGVAGEVARLREVARRTEQHGGMPIVAACMHFARRPGSVRQAGRFLDRQRIHVGAKADHPDIAVTGRFASLDHTDNTGAAKTRGYFVTAKLPKPFGDECRGAVHVVEQFGMFVDIPAPGLDVGLQISDAINDGHGKSSAKDLQIIPSSTPVQIGPITLTGVTLVGAAYV